MPFRWKNIILPLVILFLSLLLTSYFYRLLPGQVAYHLKDPDRLMSRGAFITLMLIWQFLFVLLAGAITWGVTKLASRFLPAPNPWVEKMVSLMGNLVALPQIVLSFAMLDIFSYNSYQTHLLPIWVFALIVMGVGGITLGIFFTLAIRQVRGQSQLASEKKAKER